MKKHLHHKVSGSCDPGDRSPKEKGRSQGIRNLLILISLSIIPYLSCLGGDFVFDDAESIVNNPIVNGKDPLLQIFSRDFWGRSISSSNSHKSYRPVTTFTFWLNYKLHETSTLGYHVVNIICHTVATLVFYKLGKQLEHIFDFFNIAFSASILFAVHPVHTEAVANITGRAELLMTIFSLAALILHVKNREINCKFVLLVILSTLSKEQGLMTIPIAICIDFLAHRSCRSNFVRMICLLVAIGFLRMMVNGFEAAKFTKLDNPTAFLNSKFYRMINYTYIWLYHAYLLVIPVNLCFDYSMGCISSITTMWDLRALSPVLIFTIVIIGVKFQNECRAFTLSSLMGIISFLPASNIFFTVGFSIAERVLYLPSAGFCLLCAIIFKKLSVHFKNADVLSITLILLLISKTYRRSGEWKTELSLYSSGLSVCPTNAKIHYNLGKVLGDNGLTKDAEKNYWNAIKLDPSYEQALNNLGNLLEKSGDSKTAESLLARAVTLRPSFAVAWMNLGISQMNLKKYYEAEKSLKNSLLIRPNSAHCLFNLGVLYQRTNRDEMAMSAWKNATRIDPSHSQSWTNLFVVLDHLSQCSQVIDLSYQALSSVPNESRVHMQIGSCHAKHSNFTAAENHIKSAIDLNPTSVLFHANLGILYQRMSRHKEAESQYRIVLALDSKNIVAKQNLQKLEEHNCYNSTLP
ncbi:Protein O-mannosyl-transferase F38B6.6 [Caenorhabditis elegans]|uniref:Protein O-mannosyl-transferase F38B6.6 n=1 Tax=Caenorhabditis elegans TaxID=6239 RepID=TMTC1_CAEEL|nr:Protein O-mannosyl-transferase TMTC1 [Caenorhabditis elegans]Q20144.2 RecName: Full=Protein O-mannosyl-transferase TMTC1; AltName: Full=Transmembrane and TPR repeat-containing protein F38B6.6 [Caenorhabditis elegans]CCD68214.1 Protein O-mannosyl-transferase TMTC1 [Caenorhabditis elegans]|eukprot:NP_509123.2 Transmembrane and TPR repeat-containing protein F38B6.6 [Caenorhabditis elegans]